MTKQAFITMIKPYAVKISREYNIPLILILSQAAHETGFGTSELFKRAVNLFGITPGTSWKGDTYKIGAVTYRKYNTLLECFQDYANLIKRRFPAVIGKTDLKAAADVLQNGYKYVYAEDPKYTDKLVRIGREIGYIIKETPGAPLFAGLTLLLTMFFFKL